MPDYRDETVQKNILASGSREDVIAWLLWNDPQGCYSDEECKREGGQPLTLEEARGHMASVLNEGSNP